MAASFPTSILITGANRGLGLEFVKQILQKSDGATKHIFAAHRSPLGSDGTQQIEQLSKEHSGRVHLVQIDVTDQDTIKKAAQFVETIVGDDGLNVLVNNSGVAARQMSLDDLTFETLDYHLKANTIGPILVLKGFHALLKRAAEVNKDMPLGWKRGAVLYLSSMLASLELADNGITSVENPTFRMYSYRASKGALNVLSHSLATELSEQGISSLILEPGWVRTDMGGEHAHLSPEESIAGVLKVAQRLDKDSNGKFVNWGGEIIPW
ncbi:C-signal-like [Sycon ciliatum]|uniref:C-signal-like n=1 Tax=Sycon ciliatum TaxID=27933 RepID=UPI0031F68C46